ncbi:hypothetical protein [Nocardia sp. NPDC051832]|uniref:hypothetical protein n=1 Tax=Nocardia sp. NPDC051832 TaxID=3155673 RepID=UPI003436E2A0
MPITPQHLDGIVEDIPALTAYRRTATRLHPRRGAPGVHDSSVGGPLLWPADEPWPVCTDDHQSWFDLERPDSDAVSDPVPMIPVAQLHRRDIPDYLGPEGSDLIQFLWCPIDHDPLWAPAVTVRWRRSADVTGPLLTPPDPPEIASEYYLPAPCLVSPEQITEYEYHALLPADLAARVAAWEERTGRRYSWGRSITTGWKVGGYASWSLTDPQPMNCESCGSSMTLLLKAHHCEWDGEELWHPAGADTQDERDPTGIVIGRGYALWMWVCDADFEHPVGLSMQ